MIPIFVNVLHLCILPLLLIPSTTHGQEAPRFSILNEESQRTNFCERHNRVESGLSTRRDALKGMQITAGIYPYQLGEDGETISKNDPGISILFLDAIAERGNFEWRNSFGLHPTPEGGNSTWDTVLYQTTELYDIGGEWFWQTIDRMSNGILFPEGFYDGSLIMVGKTDDFGGTQTFDMYAFMAPFTSEVWWLLLATVFASALVFYVLQYLENGSLDPFDSLFVMAFSFTGHYFFLPRTHATRLFSLSVCALSLVMVSSYTANLASFLVLLNQPTTQIEQVRDAVKLEKSFCVHASSFPEMYMQNEYPTAKLVPVVDDNAGFESIDVEECDMALASLDAWENARRSADLNGECNKKWIGRVAKFQQAGFPIGDSQGLCTSLLRDVVEIILIDMKNDGSFDRIWKDFRDKRNTNSCDSSTSDDEEALVESFRLDVNNVGGVFVFHGAALAVAVIFSLIRYSYLLFKEPATTAAVTRSTGEMRMSTIGNQRSGGKSLQTIQQSESPLTSATMRQSSASAQSRLRASLSRYTDDVFEVGKKDTTLFSMEMDTGQNLSTSRLPPHDDDIVVPPEDGFVVNPLSDLRNLLAEKEARDRQLQEAIDHILREVSPPTAWAREQPRSHDVRASSSEFQNEFHCDELAATNIVET